MFLRPPDLSPAIEATARNALCAIALLTALRFLLAVWLPLSFDEAYYWLWSKHLALGYYDHPPMIALAIRAGTLIFGDTELGVRFVPLAASVVASWAVWRSAATLLSDEPMGAAACLLFNATLMVAAETMAATPDSLLIAAASLLLAGFGVARNPFFVKPTPPLGFAAATIWPAMVYFLFHALHDRVQGNWPCFVYPALAVLAVQPFADTSLDARGGGTVRILRGLAIPVAGIILTIAYLQAFFGLLPIGRNDPIARMMAVGIVPVAEDLSAQAALGHVDAIVTTNYVTTSWLSFYLRPTVPIVQVTDDFRFLSSPFVTAKLLQGRLLYVTQEPEREMPAIRSRFSRVEPSDTIERLRNGVGIDEFHVYAVSGFRGPVLGRRP